MTPPTMPLLPQASAQAASAPTPQTAAPVKGFGPSPAAYEKALLDAFDKAPLMQAVKTGKTPAIFIPVSTFGPQAAQILPLIRKGLEHIGVSSVISPTSGNFVAFNDKHITAKEIESADAEGKLDTIATAAPTGQPQPGPGATNGAPGAAGSPAIVPTPPGGPVVAAAPPLPPSLPQKGISSSAQADLEKARIAAAQPKVPTKMGSPSSKILSGLSTRAF